MAVAGFRAFSAATMLVLFFQLMPLSKAGKHHLAIRDDSRSVIVIEAFGFTKNGRLEIGVSDVSWSSDAAETNLSLVGFLLATEKDWLQVLRDADDTCPMRSASVTPLFSFNDLSNVKEFNRSFIPPVANRYILLFVNCLVPTKFSFDLRTSMYNLESKNSTRDYLSDGQVQLPAMFFSFFLMYLLLEGLWIYACLKHKDTTHLIHILMGVLVFLKALYIFSEAEDKAYIKRTGTPHGWDIAFYAFNLVRGVMLFTVIVLIGTGWSFLKPHLQNKEKRILMVIIPLQVVENIATVIIGETGPFWKDWLTWIQILLLVDVICCCAVLFPIVWSIKHLREAAHVDGKAARNLVKLTLFRQYYIVVVSYIYYTRIVVFAVISLGSYRHQWIGELNREIATIAFYIFTGYKFRPAPHNPYFVLDDDVDDEETVEALKDDEFEL